MLSRLLAPLSFAVALAFSLAPALAQSGHSHSHGHSHDHDHGPAHGGDLQHVGDYHLELIVEDGRLVAYLTDDHGEAMSAEGFGVGGLVLAGGVQNEVVFAEEGEGRLVAEGSFEASPDLRAVLTLTTPDGQSHRARFQPVQ